MCYIHVVVRNKAGYAWIALIGISQVNLYKYKNEIKKHNSNGFCLIRNWKKFCPRA